MDEEQRSLVYGQLENVGGASAHWEFKVTNAASSLSADKYNLLYVCVCVGFSVVTAGTSRCGSIQTRWSTINARVETRLGRFVFCFSFSFVFFFSNKIK